MITRKILDKLSAKLNFIYGKFRFKHLGKNVAIVRPLRISGYKNISIGDSVIVHYKTWLAAIPLSNTKPALLEIGEGTVIGNFNHIYATGHIKIGKFVLTADHVYISDNMHGYEDVTMPIMFQPVRQIDAVEIGDNSWLGEHVCILGAKIGRHCVIGANAVVTKDIPDYSIAVGAPAQVIKQYDHESSTWKKV